MRDLRNMILQQDQQKYWQPPNPNQQQSGAQSAALPNTEAMFLTCPWCNESGPWSLQDQHVAFSGWWEHMVSRHLQGLATRRVGSDEDVEPCLLCCRPCATEKGQRVPGNRLPSLADHCCNPLPSGG